MHYINREGRSRSALHDTFNYYFKICLQYNFVYLMVVCTRFSFAWRRGKRYSLFTAIWQRLALWRGRGGPTEHLRHPTRYSSILKQHSLCTLHVVFLWFSLFCQCVLYSFTFSPTYFVIYDLNFPKATLHQFLRILFQSISFTLVGNFIDSCTTG